MGPEGYKSICDTLAGAGIDADVTPVPQEGGDNVEFITVRTAETTVGPAEVLNVLVAKHSKFYDPPGPPDGRHYNRRELPWLSIISVTEGSITLRDRNTLDFYWGQ
jgi:hypothetical protein